MFKGVDNFYFFLYFCLQIVVKVEDNGSPKKFDISTLTLTVKTNFDTPTFPANTDYTRIVLESYDPKDSLFNMTAVDNDLVTSILLYFDVFSISGPMIFFLKRHGIKGLYVCFLFF